MGSYRCMFGFHSWVARKYRDLETCSRCPATRSREGRLQ